MRNFLDFLSLPFITNFLNRRCSIKKGILKVACVAEIKLGFMDWFLYYFIILIKECKISYKTLDKALLFSRNQVFCLKNWKLWRAPTTLEFNFFCWNFAHVSYLPMSTKACSGFFLYCLLNYLQKLKITWFLHTHRKQFS